MSVTINAKGTSVSAFTVGKNGTSVTQTGAITPPSGNNLTVTVSENNFLVVDGGAGTSLITTSDSKDLYINPSTGGGQYLILNEVRWPTADGLTGEVLKTNGAGVLSWYNPAPDYEEFVATASQTVFNTTLQTVAKSAGKSYLLVYANGVFQQEGATKGYTVTGPNQITFNDGVAVDSDVVIYSYA